MLTASRCFWITAACWVTVLAAVAIVAAVTAARRQVRTVRAIAATVAVTVAEAEAAMLIFRDWAFLKGTRVRAFFFCTALTMFPCLTAKA